MIDEGDAVYKELVAKIEACVGRYQERTDALENVHFENAIDEAQTAGDDRRILSPFLPAKPRDLANFISFLELSAKHFIIDLGCGDGRVLIGSALCRGCQGMGVDISEDCVQLARAVAEGEKVSPMLTFRRLDLLEADASKKLKGLIHAAAGATEGASPSLLSSSSILLFLYVYPTLLRRLTGLVYALSKSLDARIITLIYHFEEPLHHGLTLMQQYSEKKINVYIAK